MTHITYKEIIARSHYKKLKQNKLYYWHRLLSLPITKVFFALGVKPNSVSMMMILLSLISFICMVNQSLILFSIGFLLSFIAFLFDKVDGDLARLNSEDNVKGAVYDFVYHRLSLFLFYLGIGVHFSDSSYLIVSISAFAGFLANYIEEAEMLSFRIFSHKVLLLGEKYSSTSLYTEKKSSSFRLFKILKLFRMQVFLFYYFLLVFLCEFFYSGSVFLSIIFATFALSVYAVFQIFFIHTNSFDIDLAKLTKKIGK